MSGVRRATVDDAAEVVRLRGVMLAGLHGAEPVDDGWVAAAVRSLHERLPAAEPTLVGFVVPRADDPARLAACALGTVERRLAGPGNPTGRSGYVFNVATDPDHRRRGHARDCLAALLAWFEAAGIGTVDLRSTPMAEPLYRSLGFRRTPEAPGLRRP